MVAGNATALEAGHAFSVEPGIYFADRFGMRLEDIVVATTDGPLRCNNAPRDIAIVS
jgi:D-alanyl-D-alanine dipeptidase